jgi:3'-phosphoadenosine 5'-phosphosulfate sulfotransferase (PAPS reductase)/FAD synthetase
VIVNLPAGHTDDAVVLSVSGGKDSTASILALREANIPARYVFADTGWELPPTYDYLGTLERLLGITIDRVGVPGGMVAKIRHRAGFASRMQRWCTRELKVFPLQAYHQAIRDTEGLDTLSVTGMRAEESEERAKLAEYEFDKRWGGYVWRPLLRWTVADVLAIHNRHNIPVNPLYKLGFSRVGCGPCGPYASKEDIRLWALHFPKRVDEVEALERECVDSRVERNAERPGRYAYPDDATYFQARAVDHYENRLVDVNAAEREDALERGDVEATNALPVLMESRRVPVYAPMNVREIVAWSRTARGGGSASTDRGSAEWRLFPVGTMRPTGESER